MRRLTLTLALLVSILLLAAALRFYRLDAQSLWYDEGNSARIAERDLPLIVQAAAGDIHPPGYYVLLHLWRGVTGESEFALRSLSVLCGLVLVGCTYLLGRDLFDLPTGLLAALLGALSPFTVYYSQEARMYALLALLGAVSTWVLWRVLNGEWQIANSEWRMAPVRYPLFATAYVVVAALGLYVQYAFPFVLLFHNLLFVVWWGLQGRRGERRWWFVLVWGGMQAAVGLLYLPWLGTAWRAVTGWPATGEDYRLGAALAEVWRTLTVGPWHAQQPASTLAAWLVPSASALLAVAGLWPFVPRARRNPTPGARPVGSAAGQLLPSLTAALYLLVPVALVFAFHLYKPAYLKFLLVVSPACSLLVARGAVHLARLARSLARQRSRLAGGLAMGGLLAGTLGFVPLLHDLYFDPAYTRNDYRGLAAEIEAQAREGDAVLLSAPNQWEVFTYYHRSGAPVYTPPYRPDDAAVQAFFPPLAAQHERLFVLYWGDAESDPQRRVEAWLARHAYKAGEQWRGSVRLAIYALAPEAQSPTIALDATLGADVHLAGFDLAGGPFSPGAVVPVTLFWTAESTPVQRYKVFVQALDGSGSLVAQVDGEPVGGLEPTSTWQPGRVVVDRYGVALPADLPAGDYTLIAGMYSLLDGARLPVTREGAAAADHVVLGTVAVRREP